MSITLEYLEAKYKEYEAAYLEHLALANANNGAMQATKDLIVLMQTEEPKQEEKKQP